MVEKNAATAKQVAVSKRVLYVEQKPAPKQKGTKIGIGRLLGILGADLTFFGALLPWVTLSGGRYSTPQMYLGVSTGFFGILISQLGFFGIVMMLDGKKSTSLGGLGLGVSALFFSTLAMEFLSILSLGDTTGITIEVGVGMYMCIVGSVILILGSILAMIDARKPRRVSMLAAPAKKGKPVEALVLFAVSLAGVILLLAYPWTYGNPDAVGAIYFLFGLILVPTTYYVYKVEYWSWGTVMVMMILVLLFGILASTFALLAYVDTLAFVLFYTQVTYGVGVWKIEQAREEQQKKVRDVVRTANPEGLHCPRCKSSDVYICDDGSTYCRSCKTGFVNIHDTSAKPRSSMQGV